MQGAQRLNLDAVGGGRKSPQWPGRAGEGVGIAGSWGSLGSAVTRNEALTLRGQGSRWRLDLGIRPGSPHRTARGVGTGSLDLGVTDLPGGQGRRGGGDPERLRNGERNRDRDAQGQRDTRLGELGRRKVPEVATRKRPRRGAWPSRPNSPLHPDAGPLPRLPAPGRAWVPTWCARARVHAGAAPPSEVWARARRVHGARGVALRAACVQVRARPGGPHNSPFLCSQWTRVA